MNHAFLSENHTKRLEMPLWMLLCFAMFNVWQMGFIFFMGPSLVIDGRTPLPISMDNITLLIVASYILSIIYMLLVPHLVVWAARISTSLALLSIIGLFLPLPAAVLEILIYIQVFCCCFMIGFETFIITNMFSENSTIRHLTVAYSAAVILVAVVQNDLFPVSFPVFRILALIMLIMMMVFFMRLPCSKSSLPTYVKKGDGIQYPKKLFGGIIAITFVSALMMLGGPAAVTDIPHGISIAYTADAAGALILYFLYKKKNLYPMRAVSVFMSLSVAGFLLLYISSYLPSLKYIACVLVGFGFLPCQFLPFYGMILMKYYPSRYIAPGIIGIALVTVLIHSGLVEMFRAASDLLNLAYLSITVVTVIVYLQIAPHILYIFRRPLFKFNGCSDTESATVATTVSDPRLNQLTPREREVLDLIGCGYSNPDIAKILIISEHTVNDYTKKIYRKLDVHSRHAAAQIINRCNMQ